MPGDSGHGMMWRCPNLGSLEVIAGTHGRGHGMMWGCPNLGSLEVIAGTYGRLSNIWSIFLRPWFITLLITKGVARGTMSLATSPNAYTGKISNYSGTLQRSYIGRLGDSFRGMLPKP